MNTGIDCASANHEVLVRNMAGEELAAAFAHDGAGPRSSCRQLARLDVQIAAIHRFPVLRSARMSVLRVRGPAVQKGAILRVRASLSSPTASTLSSPETQTSDKSMT